MIKWHPNARLPSLSLGGDSMSVASMSAWSLCELSSIWSLEKDFCMKTCLVIQCVAASTITWQNHSRGEFVSTQQPICRGAGCIGTWWLYRCEVNHVVAQSCLPCRFQVNVEARHMDFNKNHKGGTLTWLKTFDWQSSQNLELCRIVTPLADTKPKAVWSGHKSTSLACGKRVSGHRSMGPARRDRTVSCVTERAGRCWPCTPRLGPHFRSPSSRNLR